MTVAHAQRGAAPADAVGIAAGFQNAYNTVKRNITQSAELVPESGYGRRGQAEPYRLPL